MGRDTKPGGGPLDSIPVKPAADGLPKAPGATSPKPPADAAAQ